jgi:hypothetical protein
MAIMGCADVFISNTKIINNTARVSGGGLYIVEKASVTIINSTILGNQAQRGGGIGARSNVSLGKGALIKENSALMDGGGVLIELPMHPQLIPPELQVAPSSLITQNTASGGAGVSISEGVIFDPQAVRKAVVGNKATDYDHDISVMPELVTLLGESAAGVIDFVGRPGEDQGLLEVRLRLTGPFGFPCGGLQVNAYWKDAASHQQLADSSSGSEAPATSTQGQRRRLQQGPAPAAAAAAVAGEIDASSGAELSAAAVQNGTSVTASASASASAAPAAQAPSNSTPTVGPTGSGVSTAEPAPGAQVPSITWPDLEDINDRTVPRVVAVTDPNGVVVFALKFVQPPGLHTVTFQLSPISAQNMMVGDLPKAKLTVRVRWCVVGERQVRPGVCEICPEGSYSFTNSSVHCLDCPPGAYCPGGSMVVSREGFWQSSPLSNQMHR